MKKQTITGVIVLVLVAVVVIAVLWIASKFGFLFRRRH